MIIRKNSSKNNNNNDNKGVVRVRRCKKGSSSSMSFIKGQWTDEEDRYISIYIHFLCFLFVIYIYTCIHKYN